jgi:hypothetical protein
MDKPDPPLRPLEAFRVILRAQYRKRPALADEIADIGWFLSRQAREVIIELGETPNNPPLREDLTAQEREEFAAAWAACKTLRESVKQGKVRLRGRLPDDLVPRDIDPQDAMEGELVIWNDMLDMGREKKPYRNVYCIAEDVRGFAGVADQYKTGEPGRPTSMQLVEAEHGARWERGEALQKIGAESKILSEWLKQTHPRAPRLKDKTIRNNLAEEHRRRIAARK